MSLFYENDDLVPLLGCGRYLSFRCPVDFCRDFLALSVMERPAPQAPIIAEHADVAAFSHPGGDSGEHLPHLGEDAAFHLHIHNAAGSVQGETVQGIRKKALAQSQDFSCVFRGDNKVAAFLFDIRAHFAYPFPMDSMKTGQPTAPRKESWGSREAPIYMKKAPEEKSSSAFVAKPGKGESAAPSPFDSVPLYQRQKTKKRQKARLSDAAIQDTIIALGNGDTLHGYYTMFSGGLQEETIPGTVR